MRLNNTKEVPDIDVGLVLKLQQKLKDVENERDKLFLKVESLEKEDSPTEERQRTMDSIRVIIMYEKSCVPEKKFIHSSIEIF